jgi:hypothetical protein
MLTDEVSKLGYLRTVQDWVIRPQLKTVAGVAGIDSIGGYEKQFVVEPDPAKLATYHISFSELAEALEKANISVGANFRRTRRRGVSGPRRWPHPHAGRNRPRHCRHARRRRGCGARCGQCPHRRRSAHRRGFRKRQ